MYCIDRSVFVASDAAHSDASTSEYDEPTVVDFDIAGLQSVSFLLLSCAISQLLVVL